MVCTSRRHVTITLVLTLCLHSSLSWDLHSSTHVNLQFDYAITITLAMSTVPNFSSYYHMLLSIFFTCQVPDLAQHPNTLNPFRSTAVTIRKYPPHINLCLVYHLCSLIYAMIFLTATVSTYLVHVSTSVNLVLLCVTMMVPRLTRSSSNLKFVRGLYPQFLVIANAPLLSELT